MALLNTGLGGATATPGLSVTLKTTYDRTLLENARDKFVHGQFARKFTIPKGGGTTVEWRKANLLPAKTTPLVEGVTPTEDSFGYTNLTVTIAQYGGFVKGSDIVSVVTLDPLMDNLTEEQGVQAGLTIDTIDRDALNAGTTVRYANGKASRVTVAAGDNVNDKEFVLARRTLVLNKAQPVKGKYYAAILHPMQAADVVQDAKIYDTMRVSNEGKQLYEGQIGLWRGIALVESPLAKVFAAAGAAGIDVYSALFFGKNAYGTVELESMGLETIFHPIGSAGAADPLNQYWSKGWKATHATKILNETFMLRLETAASA